MDTCILNEVDLTRLSHDLSRDHRRQGSHSDMVDDTDPMRESVTVLSSEQKLTEKYRNKRSPSPYVLKTSRAASPRSRPQSAPIYYSGKLDLHVVDISLSNESLSDISSGVSVSSTLNNVSVSGIESFDVSNSYHPQSVQNEMSCQNATQSSSKSHSGKLLQQANNFTLNSNNMQFETYNFVQSSSPVEQRKSSTSTYSVTSVLSADTVTTLNNVHMNDDMEGDLNDNEKRNKQDVKDTDKRKSEVDYVPQKIDVTGVEIDTEFSNARSAHYNSMNETSKPKDDLEYNDGVMDNEYSAMKWTGGEENTDNDGLPFTETLNYNQTESVNQNIPDNQEIVEQSLMPKEHSVASNKHPVDTIRSSDNDENRLNDELKLHSAKKIDIVKPRYDTQSSVESKESLETVELSSDSELAHTHGNQTKEIRRIYKPSVNSPRVNEKKTNVRNIFKHKKGRFSPGIEQTLHKDDQEIVLVSCDKVTPDSSSRHYSDSLHNSNSGSIELDKHNGGVRINQNEEILTNDMSHPTYSAKPIVIDQDCHAHMQNGLSSHEKHMSKLKTNLRAELNLSKYKISSDRRTGSDQTSEIRLDHLSQSSGSHWSQDSQRSHESSRSRDSPRSQGSQRSNDREIGEQASKSISGICPF